MPDKKSRTVYLIVSPGTRNGKAWPKLLPVLKAKVKGARLVVYEDLFTSKDDYEACWQARLREVAGAVVVPSRKAMPDGSGAALWLGEQAVLEATLVNGHSRPVLVLASNGLLPWHAVAGSLTRPEDHPRGLPVLVGIGSPSEVHVRDAVTTSEGAA